MNAEMTEKKDFTVNSRDLKGYNRCTKRRERSLNLKQDKGVENVYEKAVLIKDMIRKGLFKVATAEEIEASLELSFMEMDYPTPETAKLHAADAYRQVMRYISCEDRTPELAHSKTVRPFDLFDVKVKPDYIFKGIKEFDYEQVVGKKKTTYKVPKRYIEVVKIRCSKPNVSLTGRNKDTGMMKCLELYSMLLYARSLVEPGESVTVCASYYYLRKNSDNSVTKDFDPDFFQNKGAGNIVTLWEDYTPGIRTELDGVFKPQFEEFMEGELITNACEGCDFYEICHYTKPPVKLEDTFGKQTPVTKIRLTKTQQEVVDFRTGIACVNAGAGAGKTTSIALRTAKLIQETNHPEKICMLTFTNAGAEEMSERIKQYTKELNCDADVSRLTSTTFNAFGYEIVKRNYEELGFKELPELIDEVDRSGIIAEILRDHTVVGLDYRNFHANMRGCRGALAVTKKAFEIIKREQLTAGDEATLYGLMPNEYHGFMNGTATAAELLTIYQEYDEALKNNNLIEYADQELLIFKVLEMHPDYFINTGYEHIIVDEFQDTNELQFELLRRLIDTPSFQSFMVVGDDSQSIFGFRGSTPEYIIHFFEKLGMTGTQFDMVENHRSTPQIIEFANRINEYNKNRVVKDLIAVKPDGKKVNVNVFWEKNEDLEYAANVIEAKHAEGIAYEEIAYIAYTRSELLKMGTILTEREIPWVMLNPEPMMENSRVIAALSLAKLICDPDATKNAFVYLNAKYKGNILNEKTDAEIAAEINLINQTFDQVLDEGEEEKEISVFLGMLNAIDDEDEVYESFIEMVKQRKDFEKMLDFCMLFDIYGSTQTSKREKSYPGVVLTTAHSSKGKEWPVVINNLSNYHIKELGKRLDSPDFEERRRLLFVSATRAKEQLYVIGQAVAFGTVKNEDRTLNEFLIESCKVTNTPFPTEPEKKKKTKK